MRLENNSSDPYRVANYHGQDLVDPDTGAKEVFINGSIVVYKSAMWEESA